MTETTSTSAPDVMSFDQLTRYLGVSEMTVRRLLRKGAFPKPVRLLGRPVFLKEQIQTYLREQAALAQTAK